MYLLSGEKKKRVSRGERYRRNVNWLIKRIDGDGGVDGSRVVRGGCPTLRIPARIARGDQVWRVLPRRGLMRPGSIG